MPKGTDAKRSVSKNARQDAIPAGTQTKPDPITEAFYKGVEAQKALAQMEEPEDTHIGAADRLMLCLVVIALIVAPAAILSYEGGNFWLKVLGTVVAITAITTGFMTWALAKIKKHNAIIEKRNEQFLSSACMQTKCL